jgi:hypothetical protein
MGRVFIPSSLPQGKDWFILVPQGKDWFILEPTMFLDNDREERNDGYEACG